MNSISSSAPMPENRAYPAILKPAELTPRCEVHGGRHECGDKVSLSDNAKSLAAGIEPKPESSTYDDLKTFAAATLGMDHPDEAAEIDDAAYDAGQMVKAATTLIGLGLML